jgi:hypothetical protein
MKLQNQLLAVAALLFVAATPAFAQVDQVAVRTTGISCGTCAAVSEIYLRRLPAIEKVTISISKEAVKVFYKAGSSFQPGEIRDALKKTDVGVAEFQIGARGRVEEKDGKRFFVAGKDRFLLTPAPNGPTLPASQFLAVEGIVNDRSTPVELKVTNFKVLN